MWQRLKDKLALWVVAKATVYVFDRMEAEHFGEKLNQAMDDKFGSVHSDKVQARMALWLHAVAKELVT